jgi:hypothetical protein
LAPGGSVTAALSWGRLAADATLALDAGVGLVDVITLPAPLAGATDSRLPEKIDPLFIMMRYLLLAVCYGSLRKQANVEGQVISVSSMADNACGMVAAHPNFNKHESATASPIR